MQNYLLSIVYLSGKREKMEFSTLEKAVETLNRKAQIEKDMVHTIGTSIKSMKIYYKEDKKRRLCISYNEWEAWK